MFEEKKISKNVLDFFARKVRDAESEEEVKEIVETTNDVLNEDEDKMNDEDPVAADKDDLTAIMKKVLACLQRLEAKGTTDEDPVIEDEDPSMKSINELEDACSGSKMKDKDEEEKMVDKQRPIEEVVESSRTNTTDTNENEGLVPSEGSTFEKIVKDMKPVLAQISDDKERKLVCDRLAKSLRVAMKSNNSYSNILDATVANVKDARPKSLKDEEIQTLYDSYNPHKQKV